MTKFGIIAGAAILLAGLLAAEKRESLNGILATKPFLSGLFILSAVISPHPWPVYYVPVLGGLICCFMGDICLIFFFNRRIFTLGLAVFLAGHLFYAAAFFMAGGITAGTWISLVTVAPVSGVVFWKLKPYLGDMKGPVMAYMVIISLMVAGAGTLAGCPDFKITGRVLVLSGAVVFYISDLFVARHRFVKKAVINRYVGLPLYNTAQFALAFSPGFLN